MSLVKYKRRRTPVNNLLDDFLNVSISDFLGNDFVSSTPSINITEHTDRFLVEVAAPGLDKSDFNVKVENDHLVISAKKSTNTDGGDKEEYTRREFNYTSFERSFYLPDTVDANKVSGEYANGILTITVDKNEESVDKGPVEIKIQ